MTQIAIDALTSLADAVETPATIATGPTAPTGAVEPVAIVLGEYGQNNKNWVEFLRDFQSAPTYTKTLDKFLHWVQLRNPIFYDLTEELIDYILHLHEMKKSDGSPHYAPTTLRSKLSVFKAFWTMSGRGSLDEDAPILEPLITKWEKGYAPEKAQCFSTEQLLRFITDAPNNAEFLPKKVFIPIASCFAARGIETVGLGWDDVEFLPEKNWYMVWYQRSKSRGVASNGDTHALITGEIEVQTIKAYFACFPAKDRIGRFFRKLNDNKKEKTVQGTFAVIGKNTLAKYGQFIAKWLGLSDPKKYTGHWPRRTTTTRLAEQGRTANQIKCVTGHKSDTVVQGYIDGSMLMKADNAKALELDQSPKKRSCEPTPAADAEAEADAAPDVSKRVNAGDGQVVHVTINLGGGTINGALSLFNK